LTKKKKKKKKKTVFAPSDGTVPRKRCGSEAAGVAACPKRGPAATARDPSPGLDAGSRVRADELTRWMTSDHYREYAAARSAGCFVYKSSFRLRAWVGEANLPQPRRWRVVLFDVYAFFAPNN
jgi:hypothetical protein